MATGSGRMSRAGLREQLRVIAQGSFGIPLLLLTVLAMMTLQVVARRMSNDTPDHAARLASWVAHNPKAKAYAQLPDFHFWRLEPHGGLLNAGFGQAYVLQPSDLKKYPPTETGRGQ